MKFVIKRDADTGLGGCLLRNACISGAAHTDFGHMGYVPFSLS